MCIYMYMCLHATQHVSSLAAIRCDTKIVQGKLHIKDTIARNGLNFKRYKDIQFAAPKKLGTAVPAMHSYGIYTCG